MIQKDRLVYLEFVDVMGGALYVLTVSQVNRRDTPQNMVLIAAQNTSLCGNHSGIWSSCYSDPVAFCGEEKHVDN